MNRLNVLLKEICTSSKFKTDMVWNLVAFVLMGISGIAINFIIATLYGASELGVFNQVFAIYIILSQISTLGIHFSVVKHVAQYIKNKSESFTILCSGLLSVGLAASIVVVAFYYSTDIVVRLLDSTLVGKGIIYILPGLWFFAVNKTFLAGLNGLRHMIAYACFQSLRYVVMLIALIYCYRTGLEGFKLPVIFSIAEIVLFIGFVAYFKLFYLREKLTDFLSWIQKHIEFVKHGSFSGVLYEINLRVDILMLGIFVSDQMVGVYSLAAIVVEGVIQFMVVVRANVNPKITTLYYSDQIDDLKKTINSGVKIFYGVMLIFSMLVVIGFYVLIMLLLPQSDFLASGNVLIWLIAGLFLSSGYYPFNMILMQTGFVGTNTIYILLVVLMNVIFNAILIPYYSLFGAATATALASLLGIFVLKYFVKHKLNLSI